MGETLDLKMPNAREIERRLDQLSDRVARRVMLAGVRGGAAEARKIAKRFAPRRRGGPTIPLSRKSARVRAPGFLSRRVIYRRVKGRNTFAYVVGPAREAFYGHILHVGRKGRGAMAARPWLQLAWRLGRGRVFKAVSKSFEKAFEREAKRARR